MKNKLTLLSSMILISSLLFTNGVYAKDYHQNNSKITHQVSKHKQHKKVVHVIQKNNVKSDKYIVKKTILKPSITVVKVNSPSITISVAHNDFHKHSR